MADRGVRAEPASALRPKGSAYCLVAPPRTLWARGVNNAGHTGVIAVRLDRLSWRRHEQRGHGEQGGSTGKLGHAVGARLPPARVLAPAPLAHPVRDP